MVAGFFKSIWGVIEAFLRLCVDFPAAGLGIISGLLVCVWILGSHRAMSNDPSMQ